MKSSRTLFKLTIAMALSALFLAGTARATLIWNGSAANGLGVFKNINIQDNGGTYVGNPSPNGSYVKAVDDATYGTIWDFYKDDGDRRSEAHGASGFDPAIGSTYYIGWGFKLDNTVNNNAMFQWKSYGSPMVQNFPLVLKMVNGSMQLHYFPPNSGDVVLWSHSLSANTW